MDSVVDEVMIGFFKSERLMIARYSVVAAIVNLTVWLADLSTNQEPKSTATLVVSFIVVAGQGLLLAFSLAIAQLFNEKKGLNFSWFKLANIAVAQAVLAFVAGYAIFLSVPSMVKFVFLDFLSTLFGVLLALCTYRTANRIARIPLLGIMLVSVGSPIAFIVGDSFHAFSRAHGLFLGLAFLWHIPLAALIAAWLSSSANTISQGKE